MTPTGFRTSGTSSLKPKSRKRIHHACLDNLHHFLEGEVDFEAWALRQEELESQLTPEPELPFMQLPPEPEDPAPDRPSKRPPRRPVAA